MKILLGFLDPASGGGTIFGLDILRRRRDIRRLIGYMPESDCLIPGTDAVTLTAYLGELSGMPRTEAMKRAHDVLYYVGLEEARYRRVDTYSTGMKQRLKLAQALVHDPKLLLLDKPTSGMDPNGRRDMIELIRDIAGQGSMNIIISSHLLPDIEQTCQRVLIMNRGRIAANEPISALHGQSSNAYEVKFAGDADRFHARLTGIGVAWETDDKALDRVRLPAGLTPAALFGAAVDCGGQIRHFRRCKTSLEDAFMKVIRESDGY
jgi:ABC-2 type transport system ATP-binding protein